MIEAGRKLGDKLIMVVNNDKQQILKKGKIILDQENRMRLMRSLRDIDDVVLSVDEDPTQVRTLEMLAKQYPNDELIFANGGDRDSEKAIPESDIAHQYGIELVFGVGTDIRGYIKPDSSTRINQATGNEKE